VRISLKYIVGLASCLAIGSATSSAHATTGECQRTILKEYRIYARQRALALQKCEDKIVQGKSGYPVGLDCRSDLLTQARIADHEAHLRQHVRSACGGKNKVCNASDTGNNADVPLAAIGWDIGTCPDFEGSGCTNAIADCNHIADCLFCTTDAAQSQALALYYDSLNVPTNDKALEKCQREIGKQSVSFLTKKLSILQRCERKVMSGDLSGPCPDIDSQQHIDTLQLKLHKKICQKCGGSDKVCGGAPDRTMAEIGFMSACPNVTVPGGAACGGAVANLDDMAACIGCVSEFKVDCLDALSVPISQTYPPECNAAP
jgi:hypothetical protein